jgi:cell division protein FtsL
MAMHVFPIVLFVAAIVTMVVLWGLQKKERDLIVAVHDEAVQEEHNKGDLADFLSGLFYWVLGLGIAHMVDGATSNYAVQSARTSKQITPLPKIRQAQLLAYVRLGMQVLISLVVLAGALYIILSMKYDAKDKHWAYGSIGTIIGYWLKH